MWPLLQQEKELRALGNTWRAHRPGSVVTATPQGLSTCTVAAQNLSILTAHGTVTLEPPASSPWSPRHCHPGAHPPDHPGCSTLQCLSLTPAETAAWAALQMEHITPALLCQGWLDAPQTSEGCSCNLQNLQLLNLVLVCHSLHFSLLANVAPARGTHCAHQT